MRAIEKGGCGAYNADGKYNYFLVKWTEKPWQIEKDCVRKCGAEDCQLRSGDWVCHGIWLNYVPRANHWYTIGNTKVLVRCQSLLQSKIQLLPHSPDNKLPRMNEKSRLQAVALNPLRLRNEDHDFLMDAASLLEGLNYEEEIPDGPGDEEEGDDDEEEKFGEM